MVAAGAIRAVSATQEDVGARAALKVKLCLLPVFVLVTFVNYLDRGNIGYAAAELKELLGLGDAGYGAVAGSLFYTYVLFQWPHAWVARRAGERRWLAFVVALWGAATVCTAWVAAAWQLVLLRLVVGFAEAGAFPLIYMKLDSFLPGDDVAFCWSIVVAASQVSSIFSGPIAAGLLQIPLNSRISGHWQWLFIVEGACAVLAGLVVFVCLLDSCEDTRMLSEAEKEALMEAKAASHKGGSSTSADGTAKQDADSSGGPKQDIGKGALDWRAWYLGMVELFIATPVYAFMFFSPMLIHSILGPGTPDAVVDTLNGIPYVCAALFMLLAGATIKLFSDRLYHGLIGMSVVACLAFTFPSAFSAGKNEATFVHLSILYGVSAALYIPLDTMPSAYCAEAAGSYSIVNSVKSISGIIGPPLFGAVKQAVSGPAAVAVLGVCELLGLASFMMFFVLMGEAKSSLACYPSKGACHQEPTMVSESGSSESVVGEESEGPEAV